MNAFQKTKNPDHSTLNKKIQVFLDSVYSEDDFGGATIGITENDGKSYAFSIGYSNVEEKLSMPEDALMLGGSTGKIFVSASIMQLVEAGRINLDEKAEVYLGHLSFFNRIQNSDTFTVRDLLRHSTGISRYVFQKGFMADVQQNADKIWKPEELLSYVYDLEPLFPSGSDFSYSDTNYIILGLIIEEISGVTMYEYIAKNILIPHNLHSILPQINRHIPGIATGYNAENDPLFPGVVVENEIYKYAIQFEWAGGGYIINSKALAQAGKLLYEGKFFTPELLPEYYDGIDAGQLGGTWGLGVHVFEVNEMKVYGHTGFFPGFITNLMYFPEKGISICFQVNTSDQSKLGLYKKLYGLVDLIKEH